MGFRNHPTCSMHINNTFSFLFFLLSFFQCCNVVYTIVPFSEKGPCPKGKTLKGGTYCWSKTKFDIGKVNQDKYYSECCKLCPETFEQQLSLLEVSETSKSRAYEKFKQMHLADQHLKNSNGS